MKKVLSSILISTMVLSAISTEILATQSMENPDILQEIHTETLTSGSCGDNATYSFDSATGTLTISGTGDMAYYYSPSNTPWYFYNEDIKTVVISEGITSIGRYAFYFCLGLTSVTIPDSVTSIGAGAFHSCSALTYVNIPSSVNEIGKNAFDSCSSLSSIVIPDKVTSIGEYTFYKCSSLSSVSIPDSVIHIDHAAFSHCTSLLSVTLPDSLTSLGNGAFGSCTSLKSVIIPKSVKDYLGSFSGCSSLTSIIVDENNPNYISIDGVMFTKNITELVAYPSGKNQSNYQIPESVTSIRNIAFSGNSHLTTVTIPNAVSYIGPSAFSFCTSLSSVTLPESLTSIESYTFSNCSSLTSISIPKSVTFIDFSIFSTFSSSIPLTTVNYGGTESQRTAIDISSGNDPLETAEWIYNYQDPSWTEIKSEEDSTPATPLPVATLYSSYLTNISGNSITSGSLPSGLGMLSNGTLGGIPTQQGDFDFYIGDSRYSLHIQENTNENVESDNDFEIIERVPTVTDNFEEYVFEVSGEFPNFLNFYLDGRLLVRDVDYYAEEGSTRITLYAWTIGQLPEGMHTINATFTYGSGNNIEVQKVSQSFSKTSYAAPPSDYTDYVSPTMSGNSGNSTSDTASYVAMNFTNVSVSDWFYTQVEYMYKTKTFSGTTATTYSPNDTMTRAMMAVVLYAFAEKPETSASNISDVLLSDWYGNAIHWMGNENIVENSGDFRPNDPITREETAVMMYNFCKSQNISLPSVSSSEPNDFDSISASGKIAVETLFQQGIFGGDELGNFNPSKTATRAEISTIMKNFMVYS